MTDEQFWNTTPKYIYTKAKIYERFKSNENQDDSEKTGFIDEIL